MNVRFSNVVCHGVCGCLLMYVSFLDSVVGWPGTSLGSPASVMTEDQWLANTSCGSPGSLMCHQQHRLAGAWLSVVYFPCVPAVHWVDGCPSQRARGRLQEHYLHLIVCVQRSLTEILEAPQVSCALCPWPKMTHGDSLVFLYLFFFHFVYMCVHSSGRKLTLLWPSPSAWFPHTLSKPFNGF